MTFFIKTPRKGGRSGYPYFRKYPKNASSVHPGFFVKRGQKTQKTPKNLVRNFFFSGAKKVLLPLFGSVGGLYPYGSICFTELHLFTLCAFQHFPKVTIIRFWLKWIFPKWHKSWSRFFFRFFGIFHVFLLFFDKFYKNSYFCKKQVFCPKNGNIHTLLSSPKILKKMDCSVKIKKKLGIYDNPSLRINTGF